MILEPRYGTILHFLYLAGPDPKMFTALAISMLLFGAISAQKSIKPLFPPESMKSYHSGGGHGGPDYIDSGIYGTGLVPGKVSFGGLGDLGGTGGILGGPETIPDTQPISTLYPDDPYHSKGCPFQTPCSYNNN